MVTENILYCGQAFWKICQYWWLKAIAAGVLVTLEFFFDSLQSQAMVAVLVLIVMDFATALFAALKTEEQIKSSKVLRTAVKIAAYFILISAAYKAEAAIPISLLDDTVIAFLAATELVSILENMSRAGYMIPQALLAKLKEFSGTK